MRVVEELIALVKRKVRKIELNVALKRRSRIALTFARDCRFVVRIRMVHGQSGFANLLAFSTWPLAVRWVD